VKDVLDAKPTILDGDLTVSMRNVCMMHTLERIAERSNKAGVPFLVLKGAALNLVLYERPDDRPMGDLDLLIKPEDLDRTLELLAALGCVRGEPLVREDFFPRFYYETEFKLGDIRPVRIDLHVRPFRPLRYAQRVPTRALWEQAQPVQIGRATVLVPSAAEMLIHLAVHSAVHGNGRRLWLEDIKRWVDARRDDIDWDRFAATVEAWGLTLPTVEGIRETESRLGRVCPSQVMRRLSTQRVGWRDRLALAQAPRDASHPIAHVAVDFICTPGRRFTLAYLWAMAVPGREHMGQWYLGRHRGWLPCAHALRLLWPILGRIPRICDRFSKIRTRDLAEKGTGVFAKQDIEAGEVIARCRGRAVSDQTETPGWTETRFGRTKRYELTGKLRFLGHTDRPNARLSGRELIALGPISAREEITIDIPEATHDLDAPPGQTARASLSSAEADAA